MGLLYGVTARLALKMSTLEQCRNADESEFFSVFLIQLTACERSIRQQSGRFHSLVWFVYFHSHKIRRSEGRALPAGGEAERASAHWGGATDGCTQRWDTLTCDLWLTLLHLSTHLAFRSSASVCVFCFLSGLCCFLMCWFEAFRRF